jgi:hypothetical protein
VNFWTGAWKPSGKQLDILNKPACVKAAILVLATIWLAAPQLINAQDTAELDQAKWAQFVPSSWKLLLATEGALSGDAAAALVVEEDNPANTSNNDGMGEPMLNYNPRRLLILSKTASGYRKISSAESFLPTAADPDSRCLADPLMEEGDIKIENGLLKITLGYWLSCGSWSVSKRTFIFRKENARFRLIGLDSFTFSRASGEGSEYSSNYLTGRKKTTNGVNMMEEPVDMPKPKVNWKRIGAAKFYLDAMKNDDCANYEDAPSWCYD